MKYSVKYSLLIMLILIISACKTQEIYKISKNGDISIDLTVVIEPTYNVKTKKPGTLIEIESSLNEIITVLSKANWDVEANWLSRRTPYKLRMKLVGNINKVSNTTIFYKFTNIGGNVIRFILNGSNVNNVFNVNVINRAYTFKSTLFSDVQYYDVDGDLLKKNIEYHNMDAVYVFLENDNRTLREIKSKAAGRNKSKKLANNTTTKHINEYFPTCNGSRYMITPDGYPKRKLSEIKNYRIFTVGEYLNKADELNGTVWKGSISLVGDVSRELHSLEEGWSEWRENKTTYMRLDVQVKNDGKEEVVYKVKSHYWLQQKEKAGLQTLSCVGVDHVAGARALNNIGVKYLNNKNYKKSLIWFVKAANEGYSLAEYYTGYLYENGFGVTKSTHKAILKYIKSANDGNAIAQNHLGNMYSQGLGVNQSNDEAYGWYKKSAEQENALAQSRLGFLYLNGLGVQKSEKTAIFWYKKSAEQGNALAQSILAKSYKKGIGVAKDEKLALIWHSKAAAQGFKGDSEKYSNLNKNLTLANQKYSNLNKSLTITNKKLLAKSIKTIKENKALAKTNIKITKANIKTTLKNRQLVKTNKKLIAKNKRLVKISKKLAKANKTQTKPASIVKKTHKAPVKAKQSTDANKTNQQPKTKTHDVVQQSNKIIKLPNTKDVADTQKNLTKMDSAVATDKPITQATNKSVNSTTNQPVVNDTTLKEGTVAK